MRPVSIPIASQLMKTVALIFAVLLFGPTVAPVQTPAPNHLSFSSNGVALNGKTLRLPCTQSQIESVFGKPTEIDPATGDDLSDTVIEWSNIGAYAYMRPKTGVVHAIGVSLSKTPQRNFERSFIGAIYVQRRALRMTVGGFRSAGFQRSSKYANWERRLGSYYILVDTEPEAPEELEFGVHLNDR